MGDGSRHSLPPEGARGSRPRINGAAGQRKTPTSVLLC
jgi:hypothetical protein